jgi:hypothetical protein
MRRAFVDLPINLEIDVISDPSVRRISQRPTWFSNHAEPESHPLQLLVD